MSVLRRWLRPRRRGEPAKRPSLEIHVPISPTRQMFNMAQALTLSLRLNGGSYADAAVILTVGESSYSPELRNAAPRWLTKYNAHLNFVPAPVFDRYSWYGTALQRFRYGFKADVVLMLDADILIARPFDDLVQSVAESQEFAGMIAHMCPFGDGSSYWPDLFARAGLAPPALSHEHISWGALGETADRKYCPAYFNLGVLCAPAALMTCVGQTIFSSTDIVESALGDYVLKCQLALALSIARDRLPYRCLPIIYNFPNAPVWVDFHRASLADAVFLHLHSHNENGMMKTLVFQNLEVLRNFIERTDLTGADASAQGILDAVLPQMIVD